MAQTPPGDFLQFAGVQFEGNGTHARHDEAAVELAELHQENDHPAARSPLAPRSIRRRASSWLSSTAP